VTYSNAVIATPSVSFTYDTNYDRLLTMSDDIGTTAYAYHTVTNGVLGAGRLATVDGPRSDKTVTYNCNALGSFTNVHCGATERIATNFYPNGPIAL